MNVTKDHGLGNLSPCAGIKMDSFGQSSGILDQEVSEATFDLSLNVLSVVFLSLFLFGLLQFICLGYRIFRFAYIYIIHSSKLYRYHRPGAWALVTGASQGIGTQITRELAKRGFNVVLHGRNQPKLEALIVNLHNEFPAISFKLVVADASNSHGMKAAIQRVADDVANLPGPLTVLVNNVGAMHGVYGAKSPFVAVQDQTPADLDAMMNLNARFTAQLTRAVLPVLAPRPSTSSPATLHAQAEPFLILNLSSLSGYCAIPFVAIYAGSKAFIQKWSEALSQELAMQPRLAAGEALCIQVGTVTGAGGHDEKPGLFSPDAATFARHLVDKVGCGKLMVAGHWAHGFLMEAVVDVLPEWLLRMVYRLATVGQMKEFKEREIELAKDE